MLAVISSCTNRNCIYVYSPNKKQCITIITMSDCRYIINGKHSSVPDTNYVKVNLSKADKIGDGIAGCWENNQYKWLVINYQTTILENNLDTLKYKFKTNYPVDKKGVPGMEKFIDKGCYNFDFEVFSVVPENGAIIVQD